MDDPGRSDPGLDACSPRRAPGALETAVLAVLSSAERPLTSAEVLSGLGGRLAYTTVMTTLGRLHDKGVIGRRRVGRAYAYAPLDPPTVTARRMCRELAGAESRDVVLARFVTELDPGDVPVLKRLLAHAPDA